MYHISALQAVCCLPLDEEKDASRPSTQHSTCSRASDAIQYVRPDVCLAGGITHTKKIAALAEANYVGVVPHNPLGPVSTAACLQIAACIPNFALQEYPIGEHTYPKNVMVKAPIPVEDGFLIIPDKPGIGIELADDAQEKAPPRRHGEINVRLHVDGSVVDQ